jgi:hypothetical protein
MTTQNAYFLDFELENRSAQDLTTCEKPEIIEDFFRAAEIEYKPRRGFFRTIGNIFLLLIAPAEFCRSLTEAEREEIGIKL